MVNRRRVLGSGLGGAIVSGLAPLLTPGPVAAQAAWPNKPVRWIVPFAAGGPGDVIARKLAQKLGDRWGQTVTVYNKPGANTAIGAAEAAQSAPDGYTLFQPVNSTLTLNPFTFAKLPYDPVRDFTPIALLAGVPLVLAVNAETTPAKSIPELLALARARPGTLTIGGGNISIQLAVERLSRDAGVKFSYVPYKGGANDVTRAILSGEIQATIAGPGPFMPFVKTGKLRILATNHTQRWALLPDIPSLAEFGLRNSDVGLWHALVAPAGLPKTIKDKIEADLRVVLAMPDIRDRLSNLGIEPMWGSAEQFVKLIESESAAMGPLARELGVKMD